MQTDDQLKQRNQEVKKDNHSPAGADNGCPVPAGPDHHFGPSPPKRSGPENAEHEETSPTEQQPLKTQREEDQQQEDHHSSPEDYIFKEIFLEKHDLFKKWPNVQDINSKEQFILEPFAHHESAVTSTAASAQDSLAVNVSPNNNSLDGFTYHTETFTLWLTERLKQSKDGDGKKTDLFIDIMKLYSKLEKLSIAAVEAGEALQSLLDEYQKKHSGEEKQYAFAIVFLKDGKTVISPVFYPRHSKKRDHSDSIIRDTLHSEEILIEKLDTFLENNKTNVQDVFIYTHNSPCTKREKQHIQPCMSLLRKKADQWHNECGFFTAVAFKAFWGQSRPNYFNYVTDIPSDGSAFYPYIEKCDSIPFQLYSKYFNRLKPGQIQNLTVVEVRNRLKLCEDIENALKVLKESAETSFGRKTDHLERGEKMIVQSLENFQDQDIGINILTTLRQKWVEMVDNSFLSMLTKTLTADFNAAQVHLAVKDLQLGNNSPLQLYHILDRNL